VVDSTWFPPDQLFPIKTADDAVNALTIIVEQGEGTPASPIDKESVPGGVGGAAAQGFLLGAKRGARGTLRLMTEPEKGTAASPDRLDQIAHYYRLAQIVYARTLVRDDSEEKGWSYSGAPVPLDPGGIWNLYANAKAVDYPVGSRARYLAEQFNYGYTCLLKALHTTVNGQPDRLKSALGLMYEMRLTALQLVSTQVPNTDLFAAPTFEYTPNLPANWAKH
jgi:hypothetical protein